MSSIYDPDRLQKVGSVLQRYAEHIAPGHVIRVGMEGDPASTFRSTEEAPTGRVIDVTRKEGGEISFRAALNGDDQNIVTFNNRDFDPARIWEIHPDHLEDFKKDVFRGDLLEEQEEAIAGAVEDTTHLMEEQLNEERRTHQEFRSATDEHLARLEAKLEELEAQQAKDKLFRASVGEALRGISNDVVRSRDGKELEFTENYVEKFDRHVETKEEEEEQQEELDDGKEESGSEEFRASAKPSRFPDDFSDIENNSDEVLHRQRFAGIEMGEPRTSEMDIEKARSPFDVSSKLTDENKN